MSCPVQRKGRSRVVREDEDRCVIRWVVTPPPFPGVILPRTPHRPEHIPAKNPGPDILERLSGDPIVDAAGPAVLTVHFPEHFGVLEPRVQLEAAHPERIV